MKGENRKKAFKTWGTLFETYVNQTFEAMANPASEKYVKSF